MSVIKDYLNFAINKLEEVEKTQDENIEKASQFAAEACMNGGRIYGFGTGHSHITTEDIYIRAGGLALVKNLSESSMMLHEMPNKSTYLERLDGYSKALLELYKIDSKDTLIIVSNSGRNAATVEMAMEAKKIGCKVIAITSMKHSSKVSSRHKSGLKLYEVADVTVDTCSEFGDAAFCIENKDTPMGATSNITGTAIAHAIIIGAVDIMTKKGFKAPVFRSSNVDGADEYNNELFDKYYSSIK